MSESENKFSVFDDSECDLRKESEQQLMARFNQWHRERRKEERVAHLHSLPPWYYYYCMRWLVSFSELPVTLGEEVDEVDSLQEDATQVIILLV